MTINSNPNTHYVSVEKLQIGLYIHIDLPWFQHPFTLNSFRISSEDQIRTLKSLGKQRFRYDPERSDVAPDSPAEAPTPTESLETAHEAILEEVAPELAAKQERIRILNEHRRRIEQVDKAFLKASGILRNLNRNLMNKSGETLQEMTVLVDQMVTAFLEHPEVTLHVMGEKFSGVES